MIKCAPYSKEYRQAGIDPAQMAIYDRQQREMNEMDNDPSISPVTDNGQDAPSEKILHHVRKQSKEALRGLTRSTRSVFRLDA